MIDQATSSDPVVRRLLESHPKIGTVSEGPELLAWDRGDWHRHLYTGRADVELRGLVELMDNNPLVCTDEEVLESLEPLKSSAVALLLRFGRQEFC